MGHKGRPLGASMPNFSWQNGILPDLMHNVSNVCKMVLRCLVGHKPSYGALYGSWGHTTDNKHRAECELLGVFPSVWRGGSLPWRLNGLEHAQVRMSKWYIFCIDSSMDSMSCLPFPIHNPLVLFVVASYCESYDIHTNNHNYLHTHTHTHLITYSATQSAHSLTYQVEERSMALVYPHYTEVASAQGKSYWSKSSSVWKMSQKHLVLLVLLPTTLRGMVSCMHEAVCRIAEGMRLINGQALSFNQSRKLCTPPGSLAGKILRTHTHARTQKYLNERTHAHARQTHAHARIHIQTHSHARIHAYLNARTHRATQPHTHLNECTHAVHKPVLPHARSVIILGASMFEGSMPVSVLVPSLHRLLHYGWQTKRLGRLQALAMWGFEQFNFLFKTAWIRNNSRPMTSAGMCFPLALDKIRILGGMVYVWVATDCLVLFPLGFDPVALVFFLFGWLTRSKFCKYA